jgi:hypothetical protein
MSDTNQAPWKGHAEHGLAGPALASRVEPETVAYLSEVSSHFASLDDPEEKQLLLANVLEELQGKELRIATDAATSRMLEALLASASASQLMQFLQAFTNEDELYKLAGGYAGLYGTRGGIADYRRSRRETRRVPAETGYLTPTPTLVYDAGCYVASQIFVCQYVACIACSVLRAGSHAT